MTDFEYMERGLWRSDDWRDVDWLARELFVSAWGQGGYDNTELAVASYAAALAFLDVMEEDRKGEAGRREKNYEADRAAWQADLARKPCPDPSETP